MRENGHFTLQFYHGKYNVSSMFNILFPHIEGEEKMSNEVFNDITHRIINYLNNNGFKDKIPDLGGLFKGFSKSELNCSDCSDYRYLEKFIRATIIGEIVHVLGILSSIIVLLIFNEYMFNFGLPAFLLNTFSRLHL